MTDDPPRERAPSATEPDPVAWIARRVRPGSALIVGGGSDGLEAALHERGAGVTAAPDVPGELPHPDATFDAVVLDRVLEHSLRPDRILAEAGRVLKSDGVLAIVARYGLHVHEDHADGLYLRRLGELVASSFTLEAVDIAGDVVVAAAVPGASPTPTRGSIERRLPRKRLERGPNASRARCARCGPRVAGSSLARCERAHDPRKTWPGCPVSFRTLSRGKGTLLELDPLATPRSER